MYGTNNHDTALALVARAAAATLFRPSTLEHGRTIAGYEVRPHNSDPFNYTWGVWPRWSYTDRPDLGPVFGGPFVVLSEVPEWSVIESDRNGMFSAEPMLEDFAATALQDLQYSESDEACTDERDSRDTGTIYTVPFVTLCSLNAIVARFREECAPHIAAALELEPGEDGLQWRRNKGHFTESELGSTLWLAVTGSGVTFTDDGDADCLKAMAEWARGQHCEGLYFGDDKAVYL